MAVRCSDCGFMGTPDPNGIGWAREVKNTDYMPRTTPVSTRFCFRLVPDFDYMQINDDRECAEYVKYEPNMNPLEHFHLRESRRSADRTRRTVLWVGIGTIVAMVLTGVASMMSLSQIGRHLHLKHGHLARIRSS